MRYFSKIFWGLSWNVFQWIQIILNILYVFQSVSYLTYLLNICQYRNISSSWYIFLKFFDIFPGYFWNISRLFEFLYVCQSVSPSLISLPICHFWGSTSETSGLVCLGAFSIPNKTGGLRSWPPEMKKWKRYKRWGDRLTDIKEFK